MNELQRIKIDELTQKDNFEIRPKIDLEHEIISKKDLINSILYLEEDTDKLRILLEMTGYMDMNKWNLFNSFTQVLNEIHQEIMDK